MALTIAFLGGVTLLAVGTIYVLSARGPHDAETSPDLRDRRPLWRLEALRKPA